MTSKTTFPISRQNSALCKFLLPGKLMSAVARRRLLFLSPFPNSKPSTRFRPGASGPQGGCSGGLNESRLTRELEKKFSERHVVFVAQRRMLRKPTRTSRVRQKRPRSRTLTDVHEKILEDLVYPTEIVGKRTRIAVDGSKTLKV